MTWFLCSLVMLVPAVAPPGTSPAGLVAQLDSEDFTQRQAAERGLRGWGVAALPALEASLDLPDLEQRRRVQRLLREMRDEQAAIALKQLHRGQMPERLGLWNHFRRMVGTSSAARDTFVLLYTHAGPSFEDLDLALRRREWREAQRLADEIIVRALPPQRWGFRELGKRRSRKEHFSLLAALFVCRLPAIQMNRVVDQRLLIAMLENEEISMICLKNDDTAHVLQMLLYHWATASRSESPGMDPMLMLVAMEVREPGLELARKRLCGEATPREKAVAASYLGWHGQASDVPLLLPLLKDRQFYRTDLPAVQNRDVALAALRQLTKADLGTALRASKRPSVVTEYTYMIGEGKTLTVVVPRMDPPIFNNDTEREAAFAAWDKWVAAHPDKVR